MDTVAAAQHRVPGERGAVRKTEARREVVAVRRHQAAPVAGSLRIDKPGHDEAVLLDDHDPVIGLFVDLEVVVAQADIEREIRRDFPVVGEAVSLRPVPEIGGSVFRIAARRTHVAEHELRHGAAGVGAVKAEGAARRAMSAPMLKKCLPRCQDRLSANWKIRLLRSRGPICRCRLYMAKAPAGPLMLIVGGPCSFGSRETSGISILPAMSNSGSSVVPKISVS